MYNQHLSEETRELLKFHKINYIEFGNEESTLAIINAMIEEKNLINNYRRMEEINLNVNPYIEQDKQNHERYEQEQELLQAEYEEHCKHQEEMENEAEQEAQYNSECDAQGQAEAEAEAMYCQEY